MKRLVALILLVLPFTAFAGMDLPSYKGYVNDFAEIIDDFVELELETALKTFALETSHEIAVVTVESLQELPIEDYSIKLADKWKVGKKNLDNGVILLVAPNEREVRIEVGYGLEPVLTDAVSSDIIQNIIIPSFKEGDYSQGILEGSYAIMKVSKGEVMDYKKPSDDSILGVIWIFAILGYVFIWGFGKSMRTIQSMTKKGMIRGLMGGVGSIFGLAFSMTIAVLLFGFFGVLGFLFDMKAHKYKDAKDSDLPWWLAASYVRSRHWYGSGGGFGNGSGFGGFGGGGFGGGGASGKW